MYITASLGKLTDAMQRSSLVRFDTRFDDFDVRGYILAIGPRFFIAALVSDNLWLDGFECFRISDIRDLEVDPYALFAEAALFKRGERRPTQSPVSVESLEELLLSSAAAFPLVTIHEDIADAGICKIGRVLGVNNGRLSLLEIGPDAIWDEAPNEYALDDITRVNFGGDYEDALNIVSGKPPASLLKEV